MMETSYSKLDSAPILATIERLEQRIVERFPNSSLKRIAAELTRLARENETVLLELRRPLWWLRGVTIVALAALLALVLWVIVSFAPLSGAPRGTFIEIVQGTESAINELIFLALAMFFLTSLETRVKRRKALRMLHRFRSLAHIVDMHQLTKDPEHVLHPVMTTPSSPIRQLSRHELTRYLEYCSELLALVSKLAALHAQDLQDPVVLEAVNDLESLTADLSRSVWQKITILDVTESPASARS